MYPNGVYSQFNWGQLGQVLGNLAGSVAQGFSGTPAYNPPNLYPFAPYTGYANPSPFSYLPGAYNPIGYGNQPGGGLFGVLGDTYNQGPFSGSSGILILGVILIGVIVLAKVL